MVTYSTENIPLPKNIFKIQKNSLTFSTNVFVGRVSKTNIDEFSDIDNRQTDMRKQVSPK